MSTTIMRLNTELKKITTASQLESLSATTASLARRRMIGTQPASQMRRKHREGLTCGAKRIQAGRPSMQETGVTKAKSRKRKRNLCSIDMNVPNAKSHGSGH